MRTGLWIVAVMLVAGLAAGCGGKQAEQPSAPTAAATPAGGAATPAGGAASPAGVAPAAGAVTILGKDNLYDPASVTIKAGQEVEFTFKNEGTTVHNVIIQSKDQVGQDFNSDIAVNAGQESKFKVKIDKPGTYTMQCTYHPEMKGELKVEP
jgi:plastocyanin